MGSSCYRPVFSILSVSNGAPHHPEATSWCMGTQIEYDARCRKKFFHFLPYTIAYSRFWSFCCCVYQLHDQLHHVIEGKEKKKDLFITLRPSEAEATPRFCRSWTNHGFGKHGCPLLWRFGETLPQRTLCGHRPFCWLQNFFVSRIISLAKWRFCILVGFSPLFVTWSKRDCANGWSLRGCIGTFSSLQLEHGLRKFSLSR